jgi:hypothetical protein
MASPAHIPFIRRHKSYRTFDSTCTRCFLTVATDNREAEVDQAERSHVCNPWLLEQWKELFEHHPAGKRSEQSQG